MKRLAAVAVLLMALGAREARAEPTGAALPGLEAYDEMMTALLKKWDVPGAGLAVAHRDKLLLVRGYGLASKERGTAVGPTSLFRIASLSKTITAVAVLQLVQAGRLKLDDKVLPILGEAGPRPDHVADSRVRDITVRHLLQHSGGFDRERSGDVVFMPRAAEAARRQGGSLPPDCPTVLRDTLERKLDFAPGERFAYSNVGYCILGRIVERVTGSAYETYAREHVLAPAGAARMRVGRTLQAAEGEVTYYDYRGAKEVKAMPGRRGAALLDAATLAEMNAPRLKESPDGEESSGTGVYYGLGIRVRPVKNGVNLFHTGSIPGTSTLAVRTADGFAWVVMFNSRPQDKNGFRGDVDRGLWAARGKVKQWPDGDLFDNIR